MTEQQACTLCGAGGHTAAQCNWNDRRLTFTLESLTEALGNVVCLHELGVELIAANVFRQHPEQAEGAQGAREACAECSGSGKVYDVSGDGPWTCYACANTSEVVGYANGDELDNMLDDRTAVLSPVKTGFHTVPVYRRARAALAQPSPCKSQVAEALRVADWSNTCIGNKALILAAIEQLEAQPSPAPELERPEVVGYCDPSHIQRMKDDKISGFMVHDEKGTHISEPLMIVAQHAGIIAKWADLLNRANDRADAAQARVAELEAELADANASAEREELRANGYSHRLAELEKQEPFAYGNADELDGMLKDRGATISPNKNGHFSVPLYRAPVAQAGQVPEGWKLVPIEPTEWPLEAGVKAYNAAVKSGCEQIDCIYEALHEMLAAAPAQGGE